MTHLDRYHRQKLLAPIGASGQERLASGSALIVGCGALGTVAADLLARAGVGRLVLVDRDIVELTNLQRQTLFDEADAAAGTPKAEAAASRLRRINSSIAIEAMVADVSPRAASKLMERARPGVVLDCTDNFDARYLLNDLSVRYAVPLVYGAAVGTVGMACTFTPNNGPCLRCIYPEPPPPGSTPTCDTVGVLGAVTAMIGAAQAADAMKILTGAGDALSRTLLEFDLWANRRRRIDLRQAKDPVCPCCVQHRFDFLMGDLAAGATVLCGRDCVQIVPALALVHQRLDLAELARRLAPMGAFEHSRHHLRGPLHDRGPDGAGLTLTLFPDGRALVHGTTDPAVARSVYAKLVGV